MMARTAATNSSALATVDLTASVFGESGPLITGNPEKLGIVDGPTKGRMHWPSLYKMHPELPNNRSMSSGPALSDTY